MIKKLYLHYTNSNHRGPGKVVQNLLAGLEHGASDLVEVARTPGDADLFGCLQTPQPDLTTHMPSSTLMGPNIFVLPIERPDLVEKFRNFVVPSVWVKHAYESCYPAMEKKNIQVWPVGIRHDLWFPKHAKKDLDCFIYFKNRTEEELRHTEQLCENLKLSYEVIQYGNYNEQELKNLCHRSRFAILLTGTESQGIAYMNILATNTPCFVFSESVWDYKNAGFSFSTYATSVPYFDEKTCGRISQISKLPADLELFEHFIDAVHRERYNPRQYILDNHCFMKAARNYVKLFNTIVP